MVQLEKGDSPLPVSGLLIFLTISMVLSGGQMLGGAAVASERRGVFAMSLFADVEFEGFAVLLGVSVARITNR